MSNDVVVDIPIERKSGAGCGENRLRSWGVGFLAFMRSGGVLTDAQAVKFFQHGAAA